MDDGAGLNRRTIVSAVLSLRDFRRLGGLIQSRCGIKMPDAKKVMLEARLRKRLRALNLGEFSEYCEYLFSPEGLERELVHMIDVVTTNKTDFFREPRHFDFLVGTALPDLIGIYGAGAGKRLRVWSAGCSTGEEPYTIAMVLADFSEKRPSFDFQIDATDISTKVLEAATRAVYKEEKASTIPVSFRKKYLMTSRDKSRRLVRIVPELRSSVRFHRLNFMEGDFGMKESFDMIFCRNVIIYFDRPTQERLLNRLYEHLLPGGYLFMGHSETLSGLNIPLASAGPMVYKKPL
jgi:chemotaxis protein methyltransferase CheR